MKTEIDDAAGRELPMRKRNHFAGPRAKCLPALSPGAEQP